MINCITNSNILTKSFEFVEENEYNDIMKKEFENMCTRFNLNESQMISLVTTLDLSLLNDNFENIWDGLNFYSMGCIDNYKEAYVKSLYKFNFKDSRIEMLCDDLKEYIKTNTCINIEYENGSCRTIKDACKRHHDGCVKYLINTQYLINNQHLTNDKNSTNDQSGGDSGGLEKTEKHETKNILDDIYLCGPSMNIVKYLFEETCLTFSDETINYACGYGHLDIVKYLFVECHKKCSKKCINLACIYGHFDVVKYLFEVCHVEGSNDLIEHACNGGHFDIVKYLFEVQKLQCHPSTTIDTTCKHGHFDIVKYLFEVQHKNCTGCAMNYACEYGHIDIIRYLHDVQKIAFFKHHVDKVCGCGNLDIVKYLLENCKLTFSYIALINACKNGNLDVIKYLSMNRTKGKYVGGNYKYLPINIACENGHIDVIKYFIESLNSKPTIYQIILASNRGHIDIVKYLVEIYEPLKLDCAIKYAKKNNHTDVAKYLLEKKYEIQNKLITRQQNKKKSWMEN